MYIEDLIKNTMSKCTIWACARENCTQHHHRALAKLLCFDAIALEISLGLPSILWYTDRPFKMKGILLWEAYSSLDLIANNGHQGEQITP